MRLKTVSKGILILSALVAMQAINAATVYCPATVICNNDGKCKLGNSDNANWTIDKNANFQTGTYYLGSVYIQPGTGSRVKCSYFDPSYPSSEITVDSKNSLYPSGSHWGASDNPSCPSVSNDEVHEFVITQACPLSTTKPLIK